jgi:hypothetical protein
MDEVFAALNKYMRPPGKGGGGDKNPMTHGCHISEENHA